MATTAVLVSTTRSDGINAFDNGAFFVAQTQAATLRYVFPGSTLHRIDLGDQSAMRSALQFDIDTVKPVLNRSTVFPKMD